MAETHLVFKQSNSPKPPPHTDTSSTSHLKLVTSSRQLELFVPLNPPVEENAPQEIWAFCANLDQLALRHSREDVIFGFYDLVQDLFRALAASDQKVLHESHFMIWADGTATFKSPPNGGRKRPFWMFHIFDTHITPELGDFISTFLQDKIGWKSVGWVSHFGAVTFPMFEYRLGEPIVFFTNLIHPNGDKSIGYPEICYEGDEVYFQFGSIPKPMKRAVLGEDFTDPLTFTVVMMDEVGPEYEIHVSSNLAVHPCGFKEHELIARCPDWYVYTERDKELLRKYGPPQ